MQSPFFRPGRTIRLSTEPSPPMTTISPGWISRTKVNPALSSPQDSDATAHPWAFFPRQRGRKPVPSRKAISLPRLERTTREKAPFSCLAASATASSTDSPRSASQAISEEMTSVSLVAAKLQPTLTSFSRISAALTIFPLWAVARRPFRYSVIMGWVFFWEFMPVVE